jgi:hypothetical protein
MMSEQGEFRFDSDRTTRNGFASLNVWLADTVQSKTWGSELEEALKSEAWQGFVDEDVKN